MPKVVAKEKGEFPQGILRAEGEKFDWPDDRKMPRWVSPVGGAASAGTASAAPASAPVAIPGDWKSLGAGERKKLAEKINGVKPASAADADAVIEAEAERRKPAPFADAPAATVIEGGNGLAASLGDNQPDWLPQEAQAQPTDI